MKTQAIVRSSLLAASCGFSLFASSGANAQTAVDVELSLVVDGSGSIAPADFQDQLNAYSSIFDDPELFNDVISQGANSAIAVNFIQFSSGAREEIGFTLIGSVEDSQNFAAQIPSIFQIGGGTSIASGINLASSTLSSNSFDGTQVIIDVSTDGQASAIATSNARDAALAAGVDRINALGVGSGTSLSFLEDNVIGGEGSFALQAANFDEFQSVLENKIVTEIIIDGTVPEPTSIVALLGIGALGAASKLRKKA